MRIRNLWCCCTFFCAGIGDAQITSGTFSNSAQTQCFIGGLDIHQINLNQTAHQLHQTTASEESPGSPYLQTRISAAHKVHLGKMCSDLFCGCHLCWIVFVRFCLSTWAHMRAKQALKPWKTTGPIWFLRNKTQKQKTKFVFSMVRRPEAKPPEEWMTSLQFSTIATSE